MKVQVVRYSCCGEIFSACCEPHCYTDKDWLKNLRKHVIEGHTVEMVDNPIKLGSCKCIKDKLQKESLVLAQVWEQQ